MAMALVYSVVQLLLASLYPRYFKQGPLEKLWRHLAFKNTLHHKNTNKQNTDTRLIQIMTNKTSQNGQQRFTSNKSCSKSRPQNNRALKNRAQSRPAAQKSRQPLKPYAAVIGADFLAGLIGAAQQHMFLRHCGHVPHTEPTDLYRLCYR